MKALIAHENYIHELKNELLENSIEIVEQYKEMFLIKNDEFHSFWAKDECWDIEIIKIDSIGDAVKKLKAKAKLWVLYSLSHHRRAELIQAQLPIIKSKELVFPNSVKLQSKYSIWTMIHEDTIIAGTKSIATVPLGEFKFAEDKTPPSRAYLKLWEAFTRFNLMPNKNEMVLDFGSCPGGWTWVLSGLAKSVISVDGASLDQKILKLKNVDFRKTDAFKIKASEFKNIDWFCSDIICEPERLYHLVQDWMQNTNCEKFVCSIKFKGPTDNSWAKKFAQIPNSKVLHLYNNKHELTWFKHPEIRNKD